MSHLSSKSQNKLDKKTWNLLRVSVKDNYDFNDTWKTVIDLFKKRITNFYFDPIEIILNPNLKKGEGFAIVTLQCALIEMLAAFKYGVIHNREKIATDPSYEYKDATKYFIKFLKNESTFENHFFITRPNGTKHGNTPFNADDFYSNVRCGLMHEARTKKDWLITAKKQTLTKNKIFIKVNTDNNKEIHRTNLHFVLKDYFDNYIQELKQTTQQGNVLRRFLARKLDHLHDITRDLNYEWWQDP